MNGGAAAVSEAGLERKITNCAGISVDDIKPDISVVVLSSEQLKNSGVQASRAMFNNYVKDLNRLAESIYYGTQNQVDIRTLPEYENVIRAIAELKREGMKLVSQYEPQTDTHYDVKNGQVNGHH